jgi:hypothetical protein
MDNLRILLKLNIIFINLSWFHCLNLSGDWNLFVLTFLYCLELKDFRRILLACLEQNTSFGYGNISYESIFLCIKS